ncbi:MAG: carbohydrate binding domain-containing protein [Acholeplasmataceae bacterium]|nr:carbohydrate binding domain-containing protein [Acholeplasmataceae bacterium]
MKKRFIFTVLMVLAVFTLAACGETETPDVVLSAITFSGVENVTLDFDSTFNVLDGVTATGNNDVDYSDLITYSHVATTIITDDVLDTTVTGQHAIKYEVEVEGILAQVFRMVTVSEPAAVEGQMLINADFSQGTAGWDGKAVYVADGAEMTLSTEDFDGNLALKAEVVVGANVWTPRFGQMNVPFENGVTYEISFKAKASAEKIINLQVGEILDGAPYWNDFKTGLTVTKTITTEWATYSYKFTMKQDNQAGGILFELGTIGSNAVNATLWFDDIAITESTPDLDETAPEFTGLVDSKSILVNSEFDPMTGVTAYDVVDEDLTEDIVVVIKDSSDAVVQSVDTSAPATYTLTYTVSDAAGNEAEFVVVLDVVGMQFSDTNLIVNPSFETELNTETPEWGFWQQDGYWSTPAPVVVTELNTTAGTYSLDITGGGDAAWAVQFFQEGIELVEGNTYRLTVIAQAEVARKINVAVGYGDPWVEYARFDGQELLTEETTLEFLFTVTNATHEVKVNFELGSQDGFADGLVTFSEVKLQQALLDAPIMNGQFNNGWELWFQNWGDAPTVTLDRTNGSFDIAIDKAGEAFWAVQFNQLVDLEAGKTYTLSFDASATAARNINVELIGTPLEGDNKGSFDLTTSVQTFTVDVMITDAIMGSKLSFEMGATGSFAAGTVSLDNISIKEKDNAEAVELIVNGDATTVPYFMYDNAGEGSGTMVLGENSAIIDVTALGSQPYTPHFYQLIDSLAPGKYVLKIALDSSVDRDLRVNLVLPNDGYNSILADGFVDFSVVSTETNVIYVEFTVTTEVTNVKLELDFGTLGGDLISTIGMFTIHEVLIYQDLN